LTQRDASAAGRFVLMASFPPGRELPADALELAHVRRWLDGWGDELGVGWEEDGELIGAAWARRVEPVIARDDATGEPLPEAIVSVVEARRGAGLGRRLMQGLLVRALEDQCSGLSLTVSEHNPVAVNLYDSVGFVVAGRAPSGLLVMTWRPRASEETRLAPRRG
jgi:GNAT superfamily N-acetyltransferase